MGRLAGVRFLHFLSSGSITGQSESRAGGCDSLETPGGLWHPRASAPRPLRPRESRSGIAPVSPWTFPVSRGVCACAPCWVRSAVLQKHTGRSGGTASWHLGAPPGAPTHPGKPDSGHCCQCVLSGASLFPVSTGLSGLGPGPRYSWRRLAGAPPSPAAAHGLCISWPSGALVSWSGVCLALCSFRTDLLPLLGVGCSAGTLCGHCPPAHTV